MAGGTGGEERKDYTYKSITERNLKVLRKIQTGTEFMLLYAILEEHDRRIIQLEKKAIKDKKRIEKDWWLIKVKGKSQIMIPRDAQKILGIHVGDFLAARIEGKKLILALKISVDKEESVLSKKGEKLMKEALGDVAKGRITEVE